MADSALRRHDVETMFNLTYSNYLVLPRTLLRATSASWQDDFAAVVGEMRQAFAHIKQADYYAVVAADERTYGDLSDAERRLLDVDVSADGRLFYDRRGDEHSRDTRVMVPRADGDPALRHQGGGAERPGITELFARGNPDYLVLARVLLQSMPLEWQYRFTALIDGLDDAVAGIERASSYDVIASVVDEGAALSEGDPGGWLMQLLRHGRSSELHLGEQPRLLPLLGGDPVPHYDRNRARVEPRL